MAGFEKAAGKKRRVLRCDFLVGSGAAIAAGALGVYAPESAAALTKTTPEAKPSYTPSSGVYRLLTSGCVLAVRAACLPAL